MGPGRLFAARATGVVMAGVGLWLLSLLIGALWTDAPGPLGAPSASAVDACFHPVDTQPRDVPPGTSVHLSIDIREHGVLEPCQYATSDNNTWTVYWYAEADANRPPDKVETFNSAVPFTATFDFTYTAPGLHYPKATICGNKTCTSRWSVLPGILGGDGINVLPWAFCWDAAAPDGTYAGDYRAGKPVTFRITTRTAWVFIWPVWIINPACNSIDPDAGNVQIEFDHDPDANPNTHHVNDTVSVTGYDVTAGSNATYQNAQRHYPAARLCGWKAGNRICTNWWAAYPQVWDLNPLSPGFQVRWFEQCLSIPPGYPRPADPGKTTIRPDEPARLAFELRDPSGGCAAARGRWGETWTLEWFFHDGSADPNAPYAQDTSSGPNGATTHGSVASKDHTWPVGSNRYPKGRLCMSQGCAVDIFGKQWWEAYPFGWNGITVWNSPPHISLVKFRPASSGDPDPPLPTPVRPDEDVFFWASATDPDGDQIVAAEWDMGDVDIAGPLPDVGGQPLLGTGTKAASDVLAADPNSPGSWYAQLTKSYWDAGNYPNPRKAERQFYFPSVRFQDKYGAWSDWIGWSNVFSLTPCNPLFLFICAQDIANSGPSASLSEWSPEISHPGWNVWFPAAAVDGNGDKVVRAQYDFTGNYTDLIAKIPGQHGPAEAEVSFPAEEQADRVTTGILRRFDSTFESPVYVRFQDEWGQWGAWTPHYDGTRCLSSLTVCWLVVRDQISVCPGLTHEPAGDIGVNEEYWLKTEMFEAASGITCIQGRADGSFPMQVQVRPTPSSPWDLDLTLPSPLFGGGPNGQTVFEVEEVVGPYSWPSSGTRTARIRVCMLGQQDNGAPGTCTERDYGVPVIREPKMAYWSRTGDGAVRAPVLAWIMDGGEKSLREMAGPNSSLFPLPTPIDLLRSVFEKSDLAKVLFDRLWAEIDESPQDEDGELTTRELIDALRVAVLEDDIICRDRPGLCQELTRVFRDSFCPTLWTVQSVFSALTLGIGWFFLPATVKQIIVDVNVGCIQALLGQPVTVLRDLLAHNLDALVGPAVLDATIVTVPPDVRGLIRPVAAQAGGDIRNLLHWLFDLGDDFVYDVIDVLTEDLPPLVDEIRTAVDTSNGARPAADSTVRLLEPRFVSNPAWTSLGAVIADETGGNLNVIVPDVGAKRNGPDSALVAALRPLVYAPDGSPGILPQMVDMGHTLADVMNVIELGVSADGTPGTEFVFKTYGYEVGRQVDPADSNSPTVVEYQWDMDGNCPEHARIGGSPVPDHHPCIDRKTTARTFTHSFGTSGRIGEPMVRAKLSDGRYLGEECAGTLCTAASFGDKHEFFTLRPLGADIFMNLRPGLRTLVPEPKVRLEWWSPCAKVLNIFCWGGAPAATTQTDVTFRAAYRELDRERGATLVRTEWDFDGDGIVDAATPISDPDDLGTTSVTHRYGAPGRYRPAVRVIALYTEAVGLGAGVAREKVSAWDRVLDPTCEGDWLCAVDVRDPKPYISWSPRSFLDMTLADGSTADTFDFVLEQPGPIQIRSVAWDLDGDGTTDKTTTGPAARYLQGRWPDLVPARWDGGTFVPRALVTYTDNSTSGWVNGIAQRTGATAQLRVSFGCGSSDADTDGVACDWDAAPTDPYLADVAKVSASGPLWNTSSLDFAAMIGGYDTVRLLGRQWTLAIFLYVNFDPTTFEFKDLMLGFGLRRITTTRLPGEGHEASAYLEGTGICMKHDRAARFKLRIASCNYKLRIDDEVEIAELGLNIESAYRELLERLLGRVTVDVVKLDATLRDGSGKHISFEGATFTGLGAFDVVPRIRDTISATAAVVPPPNAAGWNRTDAGVEISAAADFGVEEITYARDGAEQSPPETVLGPLASVPVTAEGVTAVTYAARSFTGKSTGDRTVTVRIDKTSPEVSFRAPIVVEQGQVVVFPAKCDDGLSGLDVCDAPMFLDTSTPGLRRLDVTAGDVAGNTATGTFLYEVVGAPTDDRIVYYSEAGPAGACDVPDPADPRCDSRLFHTGSRDALTPPGEWWDRPEISPDGTQLAAVHCDAGVVPGETVCEVVVMAPDASEPRRLWQAPSYGLITGLDWSPDSGTVVWSYEGGELGPDVQGGLYRTPADGNGEVEYLRSGLVHSPAYGPTGEILFLQDHYLHVMDVEGVVTETGVSPDPDTFDWGPAGIVLAHGVPGECGILVFDSAEDIDWFKAIDLPLPESWGNDFCPEWVVLSPEGDAMAFVPDGTALFDIRVMDLGTSTDEVLLGSESPPKRHPTSWAPPSA
ncbi:MAG: hypothetical protein IT198_14840 [Acidimicrobiia bacterium]|nr:hypothetical protein [Acidimicrobiia bacterium]